MPVDKPNILAVSYSYIKDSLNTYKYGIDLLIFVQMMQNGRFIIRQVCMGPFPKLTAIVSVLLVLERTHFQFTMEHIEVMVLHIRAVETEEMAGSV